MVASINGMNITSQVLSTRKDMKNLSKYAYKKDNKLSFSAISLNKAFSKNMVEYAHTLYNTIINLKDSSKQLLDFVEEYKTVEEKIETLDSDKKEQVNDIFQKKIQTFVESFCKAYDFATSQKHSKSLVNFSSELSELSGEYKNMLEKLEINEMVEDKLISGFSIDNPKLYHKEITKKLEDIKTFVDNVYRSTQLILSRPMSEHMSFKGLNYYYNYKFDIYSSNTFKLIESGMIVDVVL